MPFLDELKRELIDARVEAIRERVKARALEEKVKRLEGELAHLRGAPSPIPDCQSQSPTQIQKRTSSAIPAPDLLPEKKRKKREKRKVNGSDRVD